MSPYRRNVMVGVVVLAGLIGLAWMLIQFGGGLIRPFAPASIPVQFVSDRADGISNGSEVVYRGVSVGRVERVSRATDDLHVYIDATVDKSPPLPANVNATIRSQGLIGGSAELSMELTGPAPAGALQANQQIPAHYVGLDILPASFADLANELREAARQFRESGLVNHLDQQITKTGQLIDSIQSLVSDPQMRNNLRQSLESIRIAAQRADQISENLEKFTGQLGRLSDSATSTVNDAHKTVTDVQAAVLSLSKQLSDRLQQASKLLDDLQGVADKINKGQGTAGALVNDNRLYQALVDTASELDATVSDLHRLIDQWEQEGVPLKVK